MENKKWLQIKDFKKILLFFKRQNPLIKTMLIFAVLIMVLSTLLELAQINNYRDFIATQISFTTLIGGINTYFLMIIMKNQTLKNAKDNQIRKGIYGRISVLEKKAEQVEEELRIIKELLKYEQNDRKSE